MVTANGERRVRPLGRICEAPYRKMSAPLLRPTPLAQALIAGFSKNTTLIRPVNHIFFKAQTVLSRPFGRIFRAA